MFDRRYKLLGLAIALQGLLPTLVAAQAEFDRGKALYENHCKECHESWAHSREGRRVNSRSELRQRVAGWSVHSDLGWTKEDIEDVTDYLDRTFYRLPGTP